MRPSTLSEPPSRIRGEPPPRTTRPPGLFPASRRWLPILALLTGSCARPGAEPGVPQRSGPWAWQPNDAQIPGHAALLTPEERDVVVHMNLARANPSAYAETFILPRRTMFRGTVYRDPLDPARRGLRTIEGSAAVAEAAEELQETAPIQPLTVSGALVRAARRHAAEQFVTGATGHYGRGGSRPSSRVAEQAAWGWIIGEVTAYGPSTGREIVSRLLIDDGVANRGHRRAILDPRFGVVGVAIGPHPRYGRAVVVDFADSVAETP